MALYVSIARRRRNAVAMASAALALGLLVGWIAGRNSSPSIATRVGTARAALTATAARLDNVPNEYTKALAGKQSLKAGVLDAIDQSRTEIQLRLDQAPWVRQSQRDHTLDLVAKTRADVQARVALSAVADDIATLGRALRSL